MLQTQIFSVYLTSKSKLVSLQTNFSTKYLKSYVLEETKNEGRHCGNRYVTTNLKKKFVVYLNNFAEKKTEIFCKSHLKENCNFLSQINNMKLLKNEYVH